MVATPRKKRLRVCSWCDRSFAKDEHLARHIRSHTHEKPFKCTDCGKRFSRHDSLLRHSRGHRSRSPCSSSNSQNIVLHREIPEHSTLLCPPDLNTVSAFASHDTSVENRNSTQSKTSCTCYESTKFLADCSNADKKLIWGVNTAINPSNANSSWPLETSNPMLIEPNFSFHGNGIDLGPSTTNLLYSQNVSDSNCYTPTWLAGEDINLDVLNASILSSIGNPDSSALLSLYGTEMPGPLSPQDPLLDNNTPEFEDLVRQNWFTYIKFHDSGTATPEDAPKDIHIDDAYRDRLASKLQRSLPTCPLPSTDFLNLCIQMYFTRFHAVFPVLHAPTFCPSPKRALLLISVCSIGSLFLGSRTAVDHGRRIFETLNKAILASWDRCILAGGAEATSMTQAALLGQTFAILSSRKKDFLTAQMFHGTLIAWARRLDVFRASRDSERIDDHTAKKGLAQQWKRWIQQEERNRIAAALFLHDIELAELSMSDRFLRQKASDLPKTCDESLWSAQTAEVWAERINGASDVLDGSLLNQNTVDPRHSPYVLRSSPEESFHSYIELCGLTSSLKEECRFELLNQEKQEEQQAQILISFYKMHIQAPEERPYDIFLRKALWHSIFISSLCDMNQLEIAIGREGFVESRKHIKDVEMWACSRNGSRCALHAILILQAVENIRLATEPPLHFPRMAFRAAITWFCYIKFGNDGPILSQQDLDFPELKILGINCYQILFEANGYRNNRLKSIESSAFRGFIDVLQRVGHWGISENLVSVLGLLLPEGINDEKYRS